MRYKAVLFDSDGTTLDTLDDMLAALNPALRACGLPETNAAVLTPKLGKGLRQMVIDSMPEGSDDELIERCYGLFQESYSAHGDVLSRAYPGMRELCARLRAEGVFTAIVSNKDDGAIRRLVAHHYGDTVCACIGLQPGLGKKPSADMPLAVLNGAGIDPADACFVGDSGIDLQTARNAHLPFYAVTWGFWTPERLRAAGAETLCADAEELDAALHSAR